MKTYIVYEGDKKSCLWKEGGLQMTFHQHKEFHSQEVSRCFTPSICFVQMSDTAGSGSRLPNNAESVSRYYHISSSNNLNTAVTLKIFYRKAENDTDQLHFLTSTDVSPPYNYKVVHGGYFTSTYGEITVETFSIYTICRLVFHYGLEGILANMENKYKASLYCSNLATRESRWRNIYLVVVKNENIFSHSVLTYIQNKYKKNVTLVREQVVSLCDNINRVTASYEWVEEPELSQKVSVNEPYPHILNCDDIRDYDDGHCPPLLKYSIGCSSDCSFVLKFVLDGVEPNSITLCDSDLPGILYYVFCFVSSYFSMN